MEFPQGGGAGRIIHPHGARQALRLRNLDNVVAFAIWLQDYQRQQNTVITHCGGVQGRSVLELLTQSDPLFNFPHDILTDIMHEIWNLFRALGSLWFDKTYAVRIHSVLSSTIPRAVTNTSSSIPCRVSRFLCLRTWTKLSVRWRALKYLTPNKSPRDAWPFGRSGKQPNGDFGCSTLQRRYSKSTCFQRILCI